MVTAPLVLNTTGTDFQTIYNALENDLVNLPTGSWNNLAISGTGSTLMRWIAAVGAFSQGANARAIQEAYLDTARSPSGVFLSVRLQGSHIIRSLPGQMSVTITRTDKLATPLVVPARTQWTIGGQSFYNPSVITLSGTGASVSYTLNRGLVTTATFTSVNTPYQIYTLGTTGAWNISDNDVWMTDSTGQVWNAITTGLWREVGGTSVAFFESTLSDGTVECKFGDGTYGSIPPSGTLTFSYITLSSAANSAISPSIATIGSAANITVTATVLTAATQNQDPPTPEFYKNVGTGQASNNGRAVTRADYRALALQYPGVIDALFRGQAELNPADLRFMNVVAVTLLTTAVWTETQWLTFKSYFEGSLAISTTVMTRADPRPVVINPILNIAANTTASISALTTLVSQVVTNFFAPSNTSLGASLEPSDLIVAIMESATYLQAPGESGELIDYITPIGQIASPIALGVDQYFVLGTPTINVSYTTRRVNAASNGIIAGL